VTEAAPAASESAAARVAAAPVTSASASASAAASASAVTLAPAEREVRLAIYRTFAGLGRPPSVAELAAATGRAETAVRAALRTLHDAHAIVLTPAGDAVRMAHPFSAAPMGYVVAADGPGPAGYAGDRMWWGGCAWDSFGIGAALGEPVAIRTRCPGCGRELAVRAGPAQAPGQDGGRVPDQNLVVHIPGPARAWWDDVVATCSNIRLFCQQAHVGAWARAQPPHPVGRVIPAATMWRLAQAWYGDRLDPDWAPRPAAAAQELLRRCGLTGDFWRLPG
jgi:Alkylmercury lyase